MVHKGTKQRCLYGIIGQKGALTHFTDSLNKRLYILLNHIPFNVSYMWYMGVISYRTFGTLKLTKYVNFSVKISTGMKGMKWTTMIIMAF